eukprot:4626518-Lingulodinium_polyedra.AAC.1
MKWGRHIGQHIVQRVSPNHIACKLVNGNSSSASRCPNYPSILRKLSEINGVGFNRSTSADTA